MMRLAAWELAMQDLVLGAILIVVGAVYLWKPDIFRRGIWMKSSVAIRFLSEDNYRTYMRALGVLLVIVGVVLVLMALVR
jgi:hypothetical protein